MDQNFSLTSGPVDDLKKLLEEVDIFWFRLGYKIDAAVLTSNTRCKILATPVTGIDHIDEKLCKTLGIKIICLRGEAEFLKEVRATAEHCILLTMMLMRKANAAAESIKKEEWNRDRYRGNEVYRKKVGILGLGRLGTIVAAYFKSMGCKIYFYDTQDVAYDADFIKADSAEEIVRQTDIISIHIPYNKENHHIYGATFFNLFDGTKWLINTARGAIIDGRFLLEALQDGRVKGVALDVLEGEPNIKDNALIQYAKVNDNLLITPHIGGNTFESFEKTEKFIASKIYEAVKMLE